MCLLFKNFKASYVESHWTQRVVMRERERDVILCCARNSIRGSDGLNHGGYLTGESERSRLEMSQKRVKEFFFLDRKKEV